MTVYVQRAGGPGTAVTGVYANPQSGYATEALDDTDPAVVAFLAATAAPPALAVLRQAAQSLLTAPSAQNLLDRALLLAILDQLNTIRAALPVPLAAITPAQAKAAVQAKAASGTAD